jgi:hypothetical protein
VTDALTLPDHATHRHRWYGLTCEQYELMLKDCGQQCEACGCPSDQSGGIGKLAIDHDASVGNWAVRGLLCTGCNATLRYDRDAPEWAQPYLANPWYRRMLAELGIDADRPEHTDWTLMDGGYLIGPQVIDPDGRVWARDDLGWSHGHKRCEPHSWRELMRRFGPHNLRPRHPGTPIPASEALANRGLSAEELTATLETLSGAEVLAFIRSAYKQSGSHSLNYDYVLKAAAMAARASAQRSARSA